MKITAERLRKKGAGCPQVAIFEKEWADGAEVTLRNLLRAVKLDLDIAWFAEHCLPRSIRKRYHAEAAPIWERYDTEADLLWKRYYAEVAFLWERYHAEVAPIWERYKAEEDPIWKRYHAEADSIRERYHAEVASIIARLVGEKGKRNENNG